MQSRRAPGGPFGGVNLNIIITPFLDMAFQLLAFFIMTYHPSVLEGHVDGLLQPPKPQAGRVNPVAKEIEPGVDEPPLAEAIVVRIRAVPKGQVEAGKREGEPRWLELARLEQTVLLVGDPAAANLAMFVKSLENDLDRELRKILREPGSRDNPIRVEADANLKHRYWMRCYDVCKLAGFNNIHFVAPPRDQAK